MSDHPESTADGVRIRTPDLVRVPDQPWPATPEAATALLMADRERRAAACLVEIQVVLERHRCTIDVSVILRAGSVVPQLTVVCRD